MPILSGPRAGLSLYLLFITPALALAWTPPAEIAGHTTTTVRFGTELSAAAGGGKWGAVWASDGVTTDTQNGVFFSRSVTQGAAWETPREVSGVGALPPGSWGASPCLATNRNQSWVIAWDASPVSGNRIDTSRDIFYVRSANGGETWSAPLPLNANASDRWVSNHAPSLVSDGHGRWVAAWETQWTSPSDPWGTRPICVARSVDDAQTWSPVTVLDQAVTTASNRRATLGANGNGTWIAAWESRGAVNTDLRFCRSTNHGQTWSGGAWLNSDSLANDTSSGFHNSGPRLSSDGGQVWVAVWTSNYKAGQSVPVTDRVVYSRSADNGLTWSDPAPVITSPSDGLVRHSPDLAWDGTQFVAVWTGPTGLESSTLPASGGAWTTPAKIVEGSPSVPGRLTSPRVAGADGLKLAGWAFHRNDKTGPDVHSSTDSGPSAVRDWLIWE